MTLTPEGLRRGRKIIAAGNEAEIYKALGLQYIEPELREGLDEIERAAAHRIPPLVTAADLIGVLHAHTTASHRAGEIVSSTRWGLAIARKSGMPADRVINTLNRESFARWLEARKERVAGPGARA